MFGSLFFSACEPATDPSRKRAGSVISLEWNLKHPELVPASKILIATAPPSEPHIVTVPPAQMRSNMSEGFYTHNSQLYFGKAPFAASADLSRLYALSELVTRDIYAMLACPVQHLLLSELPCQWRGLLVTDAPIPSAVHVLSKWIPGFQPFGEEGIAQLLRPTYQAGAVRDSGPLKFPSITHDSEDGYCFAFPVKGLGRILAVGLFVGDTNCLGTHGENVGSSYVGPAVGTEAATREQGYLQAYKVDYGIGFWLAERVKSATQDASAMLSTKEEIEWHEDSAELLNSIISRRIVLSPGKVVSFASLPTGTQVEFLEAVKDILEVTETGMRSFFVRPGLEVLCPQEAAVEQCVRFLMVRSRALAAAYGQFVTTVFDLHYPHLQPELFPNPPFQRILQLCYERRFLEEAVVTDEPRLGSSNCFQEVTPALILDFQSGHRYRYGANEQLLELSDVLRFLCEKKPNRRVNFLGVAGSGKSTVCKQIVAAWKQGMLPVYDLVLWVPLRSLLQFPDGQDLTVVDFVIRVCFQLQPTSALSSSLQVLCTSAQALP